MLPLGKALEVNEKKSWGAPVGAARPFAIQSAEIKPASCEHWQGSASFTRYRMEQAAENPLVVCGIHLQASDNMKTLRETSTRSYS